MEDSPSKEASIARTPEEFALSRVREIDVSGILFYVTTTDCLERIFKHGIVSENRAKKTGMPYEMRWKDHSNPDYVYIGINKVDKRAKFGDLEKFAIQISHPKDAERIVVLILDDKLGENSEKSEWESERLVRDRISPQYIIGIAVGGSMEPAIYDYLPQRETITSLTSDKLLIDGLKDSVLQIMEDSFGNNTESFLPIYGFKGNLLWPAEMNYKGIAHFAS